MKTILIKEIDCEEVICDRDWSLIHHAAYGIRPLEAGKDSLPISSAMMDAIQTETMHVREFYDANNNRVRIGMSKEVSNILGLQYAAVDDLIARADSASDKAGKLSRRVKELQRQNELQFNRHRRVCTLLHEVESAPFLTRLRWLFTGVKGGEV